MTTLKQILMKHLNERFIKECLTLTPNDIYEELQKSVKEWLQQKRKKFTHDTTWKALGYQEAIKELLEELKQ